MTRKSTDRQVVENLVAIYMIANKLTGECYIGNTLQRVNRRFNAHKSMLRKNKHHSKLLQLAWNKYKESDFKFEVLELCEIDTRYLREQYWFDKLVPAYNVSLIALAPHGVKHSEETKSKLRESKLGRKHSEETKRKISTASLGREKSEEHRKNLSIANTGKIYPTRRGVPRSDSVRRKIRRSHLVRLGSGI